MWHKALLRKTLFLIIYYQTLNNQVFVNGSPAAIEAGAFLGDLVTIFHSKYNGKIPEISLANVVNLDKIPQGLYQEKKFSSVAINGVVSSPVNKFTIELIDTFGNIGLHISLRFPEELTIFNTYTKIEKNRKFQISRYNEKTTGGWALEKRYKELAIKPGDEFDIIISTTETSFKIEINNHFYEYETSVPVENLKFLKIEGDVMTVSVNWNGLNKQSFRAAETKIYHPQLANLVNFDTIPETLFNGAGVTITGVVPSDVNSFISVDLMDTDGNIGLHISLRFREKTTIFNSYEKERLYRNRALGIQKTIGGWAQAETYQELAIKPGAEFEIIILATDEEFLIHINWMTYWFKFRRPLESLRNLRIQGEVLISSVQWNGPGDK